MIEIKPKLTFTDYRMPIPEFSGRAADHVQNFTAAAGTGIETTQITGSI